MIQRISERALGSVKTRPAGVFGKVVPSGYRRLSSRLVSERYERIDGSDPFVAMFFEELSPVDEPARRYEATA
jgi:hypothetical protein